MRVIVPLDRLETHLTGYDVEVLARYGVPLHSAIAECVRIVLEQSFERETPMSKTIFIDELRHCSLVKKWLTDNDKGFADSAESKIQHYSEVMYVIYKQLFRYVNALAEELFSEVASEYQVKVGQHYILPEGALFMDITTEYLPFRQPHGVISHVKTAAHSPYVRPRRRV